MLHSNYATSRNNAALGRENQVSLKLMSPALVVGQPGYRRDGVRNVGDKRATELDEDVPMVLPAVREICSWHSSNSDV